MISVTGLTIIVTDTMEEIYGSCIDTETRRALGAYGSRNGIFTLAAENMRSTSDARESIRHEVLGHYGLDTFAPDDLRRAKGFYLPNGYNQVSGAGTLAVLDKLSGQGRGLAAIVARNPGHYGPYIVTPADKKVLL